MNGQTISIINTHASTGQAVSTTNAPYSKGTSTTITTIAAGTYYQFISINGKWRGGVLS